MKHIVVETERGHGGKPSPLTKLIRQTYSRVGKSTPPFDWSLGFDEEARLSQLLGSTYKLPVKDQGLSDSCGGQAAATDNAVDDIISRNQIQEKSAKYIYSHIWVKGGGTTVSALENWLTTKGDCKESTVPSYQNGQPPSETFMIDHSFDSPTIDQEASLSKSSKYVTVAHDIDSIAQGIRDMDGIVIGLYGQNNGTWRSPFPQPPISSSIPIWGHFVFAGKARMYNGNKQIGILNSWGTNTGEQGWQWLGESYFNSKYIFDAFGLIAQEQIDPNQLTLLKTAIEKLRNFVIMLREYITNLPVKAEARINSK